MAKARGLGRGLSSLIPEKVVESEVSEEKAGVQEILVDLIDPNPFQPRQRFTEEDIEELKQSIQLLGVLQPVLVRPLGNRFQLVSGERRVRAAKKAALSTIPALVRIITDTESMEMALVENLQRRDLNPVEEAYAYKKLAEELGWTQEEIGSRVGKSRSHIANYVRILGLDQEILGWVASNALSVAHAKILLTVDQELRRGLARRAVEEEWTVKRLLFAAEHPLASGAKNGGAVDVHLRAVESSLRRNLGTRVVVRGGPSEGKIEIPYHSVEELERLLDILQHDSEGVSGADAGFVV